MLTDANGPSPNEVAEITENKIIFKCDLDKEFLYSKRSREVPSRYIDPANNRDLGTKSVPSSSSQIVTKGYRYSAEPIAMIKGEVVQRKAIKEKVDADVSSYKGLQPVYLPTYIFDLVSQVWERYSDFANIIEKKGEYVSGGLAMKVEQRTISGDVQYRIHEPFNINAFNINDCWIINTFSANSGYNIISLQMITAKDGKLMQQKSIEYQKVNGVYVPIKNTEYTYDFRDFNLRAHSETVYKNVRINNIIPAETFAYKNLDLKDGDIFEDKIIGKKYKYQDANLVLIAEPNNPSK